jgi:hypothetical protein
MRKTFSLHTHTNINAKNDDYTISAEMILWSLKSPSPMTFRYKFIYFYVAGDVIKAGRMLFFFGLFSFSFQLSSLCPTSEFYVVWWALCCSKTRIGYIFKWNEGKTMRRWGWNPTMMNKSGEMKAACYDDETWFQLPTWASFIILNGSLRSNTKGKRHHF